MITPQTAENFNLLQNRLMVSSYTIKGAGCAFRKENMLGFALFARNEGDERWEYAKKAIRCLEKFNQNVTLRTIPAAQSNYTKPLDALNVILHQDKETLEFLKTSTDRAILDKDHYAAKCMNSLYGKLLHEHNEVEEVQKKLEMVGDSPGDIARIDYHLWIKYAYKVDEEEEYKYEHGNPCRG